jgi:hypothetical protein
VPRPSVACPRVSVMTLPGSNPAAVVRTTAATTGAADGKPSAGTARKPTSGPAADVAYIPGNLSGEVRNAGQEPVSALVILIAPGDAPMGGAAAEGTPAA